MLPNPFTEVGRVYHEVIALKREVDNKANNWELSSLQGRVDALSQDVRTLRETVMDIYNKIDEVKLRIDNLENKE